MNGLLFTTNEIILGKYSIQYQSLFYLNILRQVNRNLRFDIYYYDVDIRNKHLSDIYL